MARRPSRRPARASSIAPVQTEPTRRTRREILFNQRTTSGLISFCSIASPPGHEQRVDVSAYFAKGLIRGDAQPAIGDQQSSRTNSHHFDQINRRRPGIFPGVHFRRTSKDLKRSDQDREFRRRAPRRTQYAVGERTVIHRLLTFILSSIGEERNKANLTNVDSSLVTHHLSRSQLEFFSAPTNFSGDASKVFLSSSEQK